MIYTSQIKKPSFYSFSFGYLVSKTVYTLLPKRFQIPSNIGDYRLQSEIVKNNPYKEYSVGIYTNDGRRYFIKTWHGRIKDYSYFALVSESLISMTMGSKVSLNSILRFAEVKDIIATNTTFSVVYEYIEGRLLREYTVEEQERAYATVLSEMDLLSAQLSAEERKCFPRYTQLQYALFVPIFSVLAMLRRASQLRVVIRAAIRVLISFVTMKRTSLCLAHRDITNENIIVAGSRYYLLDLEQMILTYANYDRESLLVEPRISSHGLQLNKVFGLRHSFLTYYVPLHMLALEEDCSLLQHYVSYLGGIC